MNPRRAPRSRPPRVGTPDADARSPRPDDDAVLEAAFARWRGGYDAITPSPDLLARARRAADAATRRRRRPAAAALSVVVLTAFLGAFLATRLAARVAGGATDALPSGAIACAGTQGPVAVAPRAAAPPRAADARAPRPTSAPPTTGATPAPADAQPATADARGRLAALLASATALPRPDAAVREAWVLASFDPDPRVREAAALLLALAETTSPPTTPPPSPAARGAPVDAAAGTPAAVRAP